MLDTDGKPESKDKDLEQISRMIDLELAQKRVAWQHAGERNRKIRMASFFFLFVVIVGALVAFYILYSQMSEQRAVKPTQATPSSDGR